MLSDTLQNELGRYAIGPKLRALRTAKGMNLVELAAHTGLSPAMLSKIERGQQVPILPTLLRIALVFGIGLEHFFVADVARPRVAVTRRGERVRLPDRPGAEAPSYIFESLDFPAIDRRADGYLAAFPAGAPWSEPHAHAGAELVFVLEGRLEISVEGEVVLLEAGDSAYFESAQQHSYRSRVGPAKAVVVAVGQEAA